MGDAEQKKPTRLSDKEYEGYLAERRALLDGEHDYAKSLDRWLITLAGGALGLSTIVRSDEATARKPGT